MNNIDALNDLDNQCANILHECLLIIVDEIDRIAKKNDITYFLEGGSLLGAIRHCGFIPWDDDFDVGMKREDYNRFVVACKLELKDEFFLSDATTEDEYGLPFLKIRLKGTHIYSEDCPDGLNDGIFVDVFPIDKFPKNNNMRRVQRLFLNLYKYVLLVKCHYMTNRPWYVYVIGKLLSLLQKEFILKRITYWETICNHLEMQYYVNYGGAYEYGKEIIPRECIDDGLCNVIFENRIFPIPNNPERVLSLLYGDYMDLPPIEKRVFGHVSGDIDFGKYCNLEVTK